MGEGGAILTNHSGLYDRMLWISQHPERQKREIGLHATNEIGINGRMHPAVARLALRRFDAAQEAVLKRQRVFGDVAMALAETGLVRPMKWLRSRIQPSFYRLNMAWLAEPEPHALSASLAALGWRGCVSQDPVRLIYQQPSFPALSGNDSKVTPCPVAEREAPRRFCVDLVERCSNRHALIRPATLTSPRRVVRGQLAESGCRRVESSAVLSS